MPPEAPTEARGIQAKLVWTRGNFRFDASLHVPVRGVTAVLGASGAGKSTCLRLLAGLWRPRGSVFVGDTCWQDDARRVFVPPHRRGLGFVFQDHALLAHLDVRGNLAYASNRSPRPPRIDSDGLIDRLALRPLLTRRPDQLSGGERRRAAIAQALLTQPRALFLDEPLSGIDVAHKTEILGYLEQLFAELAIPVLYVSHALDEVAGLCDHAILLAHGMQVAAGPLRALLSRPDLAERFGRDAGAMFDARVVAHHASWGLTELAFEGGALWTSRMDRSVGERVRVRVPARDVSLATDAPGRTSILNVWPAVVTHVHDDPGNGVVVRVAVGSGAVALLARVTRRSKVELGLAPGTAVYAQVKSTAIASR